MGSKGEGWVIGQFVLGAGIFLAALLWRTPVPLWVQGLGVLFMVLGAVSSGLGIWQLGSNLTAFPKPRTDHHSLVTTGIYGLVRHPIYTGVAVGALGWAVFWGSLVSLILVALLFVWFDLKSRREEAWLVEKYPDYKTYQTRVKKLIPYIY